MLASFEHYICWVMLDNDSLSLNLLKIFVQYRATLLAQQCYTMLASFEQALYALFSLFLQLPGASCSKQVVYFYTSIYFKTSEKKTSTDPNKISEEIFLSL